MEYELQPAPAPSRKAQVAQWLRGLLMTEQPFRESLQVLSHKVSIADLLPALRGFREQRKLLDRHNVRWPAALGFMTPDRTSQDSTWIPLDIRPSPDEPVPDPREPGASEWLSFHVKARSEEARYSGLQVRKFDTAEMTKNFTDMVSDVIDKRIGAKIDRNIAPPTDIVTVETDSHGVEVLFALGVFLSTAEGFGISTPARRSLPWGYYMFGARVGGRPDFSASTVWKVPDVTLIRLQV